MWLKSLIIVIVFFLLVLIQVGFSPYIGVMGTTPNFLFIFFFFVIFFEKPGSYYAGILSVVTAGFLIDLFSPSYFGISIVALLIIYSLEKTLSYLLKERQSRYLFFYFSLAFFAGILMYNIFTTLCLTVFIGQSGSVAEIFITSLITTLVALILFVPYKNLAAFYNQDQQLKLFR